MDRVGHEEQMGFDRRNWKSMPQDVPMAPGDAERLQPGMTAILYDNSQIAVLEGNVSLPVGARVEIERTDYIVDNVRVSIRPPVYDMYYECHMAEEAGSKPPLV